MQHLLLLLFGLLNTIYELYRLLVLIYFLCSFLELDNHGHYRLCMEKTRIKFFNISPFGFYDMRVSNDIMILPMAPKCPFMSDHFRKSWQRDKRKEKLAFFLFSVFLDYSSFDWNRGQKKHGGVTVKGKQGCDHLSIMRFCPLFPHSDFRWNKKLLLRHLYFYGLSIHSCSLYSFFVVVIVIYIVAWLLAQLRGQSGFTPLKCVFLVVYSLKV